METVHSCAQYRNIEQNPRIQDLVFRSAEIENLYLRLGYSPYFFKTNEEFISDFRSCFDAEAILILDRDPWAAELRGLAITPTDWNKLRRLLPNPERNLLFKAPMLRNPNCIVVQGCWDEYRIAAAKLAEQIASGNDALDADLIYTFVRNRREAINPENLPAETREHKKDLDYFLFRVAVEIPDKYRESDFRPAMDCLLSTMSDYLQKPWLQTRELTHRLGARAISSLALMSRPAKWRDRTLAVLVTLIVGTGCFGFYSAAHIFEFLTALFFCFCVRRDWQSWRVERIREEIVSKVYSGCVMAERVERLSQTNLKVPSVLPAILRLMP